MYEHMCIWDVRVGNHNACLGRVFNRELGRAALTADAAYCARQVVALERFDCGRETQSGQTINV